MPRAAPLLFLLLSHECQAVVIEAEYYNVATCDSPTPAFTVKVTLGACTYPAPNPVWSVDQSGAATAYDWSLDRNRSMRMDIDWEDSTAQTCGQGFTGTMRTYHSQDCSGTETTK